MPANGRWDLIRRLQVQLRQRRPVCICGSNCTTNALLRLTERITHWFENNKTRALPLDVERAFDKLRINGFICKCVTAAIPAHAKQLLLSYLINRSSAVVQGNSESNRRSVLAGVPRGSLLGPTFFNTDMNDINFRHRASLNRTGVSLHSRERFLYI